MKKLIRYYVQIDKNNGTDKAMIQLTNIPSNVELELLTTINNLRIWVELKYFGNGTESRLDVKGNFDHTLVNFCKKLAGDADAEYEYKSDP